MRSDAPSDRKVPEADSGGAAPCTYTDYRRGSPADDLPATGAGATGLERDVWDALYAVEDPEMPISIVDLGLIYGLELADDGNGTDGGDDPESSATRATVIMTLTYTGCPARNMLLRDVEDAVRSVRGVDEASVELVWSPEWSLELVTERGKDDLREFGLSV